MRVHKPGRLLLALSVIMFAYLAPAVARQNADPARQTTRQRALALFNDGKRLDALPLLEELAQENPKDGEILVALGASLVDHAATLTDPDSAARERFRARDVVQRAWAMGTQSPLAENLRQLLGELPSNGVLKFSDNAVVQGLISSGESAFSKRDFDEALTAYTRALELEPASYPATLFTANTYDRKNDFGRAREWYERAMRLDPNMETAYRYYADMLARQGDMTKARMMLIGAAVAEPYNKMVWREIRAWAVVNRTAFHLVYVPIPAPSNDQPQLSSAWRAYHAVRAQWQKGGRFQKAFPQEPEYRHSLPEEAEALTAAARVLAELRGDGKAAESVDADPAADVLLKLYGADLLDAYVLFSLGDDGIARDYLAYRTGNRAKLEAYLDMFVLPPAP
jgi:Flp pilus assembly protein TadD